MDFDEACAEVDRIEDELGLEDRIEALRGQVDRLEPGEDGRAEFLAALAGELQVAEDADGARAAATEAIHDGGPTVHEPRCILLSVELQAGNDALADELLAGFLAAARAGTITVDECEWISGSLEQAGRLKEALRWHNITVRDLDPHDVEGLPLLTLMARWRVRRALDLPYDAYDESRDLWIELEARQG